MPKLPKITIKEEVNDEADFLAISLQYLKEEVSDEADFMHADKHKSLLHIDAMILMGMIKHSQSSQNSKFAVSLERHRKEVRNGVHEINVKVATYWHYRF